MASTKKSPAHNPNPRPDLCDQPMAGDRFCTLPPDHNGPCASEPTVVGVVALARAMGPMLFDDEDPDAGVGYTKTPASRHTNPAAPRPAHNKKILPIRVTSEILAALDKAVVAQNKTKGGSRALGRNRWARYQEWTRSSLAEELLRAGLKLPKK